MYEHFGTENKNNIDTYIIIINLKFFNIVLL